MAEKTPTRLKLSLRSSRKDITPTSKSELKNGDTKITPLRNSGKHLKAKNDSPTTPVASVREKRRSNSKTPRNRVQLLKSLCKPTESAIPFTQECEVEWDCDSPGFSKADLKKKLKKDSDREIAKVAPLPRRMLFCHHQDAGNGAEELLSFTKELDKLRRISSFADNKQEMCSDSISPTTSSNGFLGFATDSQKTGEKKNLKPQPPKSPDFDFENLDDIGEEFFSDSLLEATQAIETREYNNNLQTKSPLENNFAKNFATLTTSTLKSPKPTTANSKAVDNVSAKTKNLTTFDQSSKRTNPSSENMSSKRPNSSLSLRGAVPKAFVGRTQQTTFRTYRSSFSLKPAMNYDQSHEPNTTNQRNLSERYNSGGLPRDHRRPSNPIVYIINDDGTESFADTVTSAANDNACDHIENAPTKKIPADCIISCSPLKGKGNDGIPKGGIPPKNSAKIKNVLNVVKSGCSSNATSLKNKYGNISTKNGSSEGRLVKKSKSVATASPVFNPTTPMRRRTETCEVRNKKGPLLNFSEDDESMFAAALSQLEQMETTDIPSVTKPVAERKCQPQMLTDDGEGLFGAEAMEMVTQVERNKFDPDTMIVDDDDDDLFGSAALEAITQVEQSVLKQATRSTAPKTVAARVSAKNEPKARSPLASFTKPSPQISAKKAATGRYSLSFQPTVTSTQVSPLTRTCTLPVMPTGLAAQTRLSTGRTPQSKRLTSAAVYSKEQVARKKEEALKRRANMARSKPS